MSDPNPRQLRESFSSLSRLLTVLLVTLAAVGLALRSLAGVLDHAAAVQADLDQIV